VVHRLLAMTAIGIMIFIGFATPCVAGDHDGGGDPGASTLQSPSSPRRAPAALRTSPPGADSVFDTSAPVVTVTTNWGVVNSGIGLTQVMGPVVPTVSWDATTQQTSIGVLISPAGPLAMGPAPFVSVSQNISTGNTTVGLGLALGDGLVQGLVSTELNSTPNLTGTVQAGAIYGGVSVTTNPAWLGYIGEGVVTSIINSAGGYSGGGR
jgi:hypothetical protein